MAKVGENIETQVKGNILTITVDLSKRGDVSKSGKSVTVASTRGNIDIAPGVKAGINIYVPNK